jgi:hypothetical protein
VQQQRLLGMQQHAKVDTELRLSQQHRGGRECHCLHRQCDQRFLINVFEIARVHRAVRAYSQPQRVQHRVPPRVAVTQRLDLHAFQFLVIERHRCWLLDRIARRRGDCHRIMPDAPRVEVRASLQIREALA